MRETEDVQKKCNSADVHFDYDIPRGFDPLAASLTQSGERRRGAPLLAEGHKLLREHGVAALRHEAGPKSGALLPHGAGARCQLLKPFDGLQRKSQAVFLQDEGVRQTENQSQ